MTLTPRNATPFGFEDFVQCGRCGTSIPNHAALPVAEVLKAGSFNCRDLPWCSAQAGVGKGQLELRAPQSEADGRPGEAGSK